MYFQRFLATNIKYTSQQKKLYKDFFKYIFMLKPKELFIIIYVNVCVKRVYPHTTNNNNSEKSIFRPMIELGI